MSPLSALILCLAPVYFFPIQTIGTLLRKSALLATPTKYGPRRLHFLHDLTSSSVGRGFRAEDIHGGLRGCLEDRLQRLDEFRRWLVLRLLGLLMNMVLQRIEGVFFKISVLGILIRSSKGIWAELWVKTRF